MCVFLCITANRTRILKMKLLQKILLPRKYDNSLITNGKQQGIHIAFQGEDEQNLKSLLTWQDDLKMQKPERLQQNFSNAEDQIEINEEWIEVSDKKTLTETYYSYADDKRITRKEDTRKARITLKHLHKLNIYKRTKEAELAKQNNTKAVIYRTNPQQ